MKTLNFTLISVEHLVNYLVNGRGTNDVMIDQKHFQNKIFLPELVIIAYL